jgi:iron complex transport system permease protein
VFFPIVLLSARNMNAMQLGDDVANGLGANVTRQRMILLLASVALTAAAVSQVGMLGFVGLMAPHIARKFVGPLHEGLLFTSALFGGLLVLAADFAGRTVLAPAEVPAGIMIALLGAPFFVFLLWKNRESF